MGSSGELVQGIADASEMSEQLGIGMTAAEWRCYLERCESSVRGWGNTAQVSALDEERPLRIGVADLVGDATDGHR